MSNGFSGIEEMASNKETQPISPTKKTQGASAASPFVDFQSSPSMPGLWQSQDQGKSWENENYVFVLQYRPCGEKVVMDHIANGGKPIGSLSDPPNSTLRYIWTLCVFNKPGIGPRPQHPNLRWPILIMTLEQANLSTFIELAKRLGEDSSEVECDNEGWDSPEICMFMPGGRRVAYQTINQLWGIPYTRSIFTLPLDERKQLEEKVLDFFMEKACAFLKLKQRPTCIGNMYHGFAAVYSDIVPEDVKQRISGTQTSTGCLGALIFLPFMACWAFVKHLGI